MARMEGRAPVIHLVILLSITVWPSLGKTHKHPTPTYFHRQNPDGSLVDRSSPLYNNVFETRFLETVSALDGGTASLSIHPFKDLESGEDTTVVWKNVIKPSRDDWIGLYCPRNDTAIRAVDYFYVTESSYGESWRDGHGSKTVKLFNLRSDCELRYYRRVDGGEYTALVARSDVITFKGGSDLPHHGHLSLTNDPSQMRIMWISGNGKAEL